MIVTTRGGPGCDGRFGVRRFLTPDENAKAYGEVVWSWRRDAGAKFLGSKLLRGDGDNKPAHRGEHEISRNPLRRESRIASAEPVCSCAPFLCSLHTRPRVQRASGFPAPSCFFGGWQSTQSSGAIAPRQCGRAPFSLFEI